MRLAVCLAQELAFAIQTVAIQQDLQSHQNSQSRIGQDAKAQTATAGAAHMSKVLGCFEVVPDAFPSPNDSTLN